MWKFCLLSMLVASTFSANHAELCSDNLQQRISSFERKVQDIERSMYRMEGILYTSMQALEKMTQAFSSQMNDAMKITNKRIDQHEVVLDVNSDRISNMESILVELQKEDEVQTEALKSMAAILTTKKNELSKLTTLEEHQNEMGINLMRVYELAENIKTMVEIPEKQKQEAIEKFKSQNNMTKIMSTACDRGDIKVIKTLLDLGINADTTLNHVSFTCLHKAASNNFVELAKLLLENGANIEHKDTAAGFTPLIRAAYFGHVEVAKFLVEKAANLNSKCFGKGTALGWAKGRNKLKMVEYLKSVGAQ